MPHHRAKKPREPERDYSHRSLLDKLGVKPGLQISVLGVEDAAVPEGPHHNRVPDRRTRKAAERIRT